jgi:hypothetical protein
MKAHTHGFFMGSLACFVAGAVLEGAALAQEFVGGNIPVVTAEGFQSGPSAAGNTSNGEFMVVWHGQRDAASSVFEILGRRIGPDASLIGDPVSLSPAGSFTPDIAYNSIDDEYLVVYARGGIFGRRVAADGSPMGAEITIFANISQSLPAVAHNSQTNEYLVVWGQSAGGVRGRIIGASGAPVSAVQLLSGTQVGAGNPAVAFNSVANEYLAVWDAFAAPFFPSVTDIFGLVIGSSGAPATGIFNITTADELQAFPTVTHNATANQYLVLWADNRNLATTSGDVFGQLIEASGALAGPNVPVSTLPFNELAPSVAYAAATDQYLAVWWGQPSGGPPITDVFARLLGPDGTPADDAVRVSESAAAQPFTHVASNPATHQLLVSWPDDRNAEGSSTDVFAQLIAVRPPVIHVVIDIKPGSFPNSINLGSTGAVPVAILSDANFDATQVDPATVTLANASIGLKGNGSFMASFEDANSDGLLDLVVHVSASALQLTAGDTQAALAGRTFEGRQINGSDSVRVVP